jgi:hypothetical protein
MTAFCVWRWRRLLLLLVLSFFVDSIHFHSSIGSSIIVAAFCFSASTYSLSLTSKQSTQQQQRQKGARSSIALVNRFIQKPIRLCNSSNKDSDNTNNSDINDIFDEAWDANVDYEKEWPTNDPSSSSSSSSSSIPVPDPSTAWDALPNMPADLGVTQLGIGLTLEPLTPEQASEIQAEAREIIDRAIQDGIDDIAKLRVRMNREMEASRKAMNLASELEAKRQQDILLKKIDTITGTFLESTANTRASTKLAAAASKAMEGTGKGLEIGTWGVLGGVTVIAGGPDSVVNSGSTLLGSMENARKQGGKTATAEAVIRQSENRILIIADTKQDAIAKQLVPALVDKLEEEKKKQLLPADLSVDMLAPTATMPIGANNAACVILFLSSLTGGPSTLNNIIDRLLRRTIQAGTGELGRPPTQLVAISTHGTERYDKFPYSMQNLMGGGKLEQRRQLEESIVNVVRNRATEPALDYTILRVVVGDKLLKESSTGTTSYSLKPGDTLDGPTSIETAVQSVIQALAHQPTARNATFSIEGVLPGFVQSSESDIFTYWQEAFLCLDGPEVWRSTVYDDINNKGQQPPAPVTVVPIEDLYNQLVEYLQEWAYVLAASGKGLTTPIRADNGLLPTSIGGKTRSILRQDGVQLLFLPTKTGRNYASREEEIERDRERRRGDNGSASSAPLPSRGRIAREGGLDVVVELVNTSDVGGIQANNGGDGGRILRVRARRCNYADDAIIKELSENTIVKRLQDALEVWRKENANE